MYTPLTPIANPGHHLSAHGCHLEANINLQVGDKKIKS